MQNRKELVLAGYKCPFCRNIVDIESRKCFCGAEFSCIPEEIQIIKKGLLKDGWINIITSGEATFMKKEEGSHPILVKIAMSDPNIGFPTTEFISSMTE